MSDRPRPQDVRMKGFANRSTVQQAWDWLDFGNYLKMKHFTQSFTLSSIIVICSLLLGCGPVSKTIDTETGIITKGGVVSSKDHYSLLIQKRVDPNKTIDYFLFLNAASKIILSDSLLNSKGTFELFMINGQKIIIENAECKNNPLGFGTSIGFTVITTEAVIKPLITYPIQKIKVFGILETEFSASAQKEQQEIMNILIKE